MWRMLTFAAAILGLWLTLSGIFTPLLLVLGLGSSVAVVWLAVRMDIIDHEDSPRHFSAWRLTKYFAWLSFEVVKSNVDVAGRILHPKLPITPTMVTLESTQRTRLGQVIFANSITLTPGTVATNLWDGQIRVHALTRAAAKQLQAGAMNAKITALEGKN